MTLKPLKHRSLRFSQNLMNIEAIILIYAWGGLNVKFFPGSRVDSNMLVEKYFLTLLI